MIEEEAAKRIELLVKKRVEEELEKRKDEIETEVQRRVEAAKKQMEQEMMLELEKRREQAREEERRREVSIPSIRSYLWCVFFSWFYDNCYRVYLFTKMGVKNMAPFKPAVWAQLSSLLFYAGSLSLLVEWAISWICLWIIVFTTFSFWSGLQWVAILESIRILWTHFIAYHLTFVLTETQQDLRHQL